MYINSPFDTALWANTSTGIAGIDSRNARTDGYGIIASNSHPTGTGMGVAGSASSANGWGVFAFGRSGASGTKSFRIDHPLDPTGRYLMHYSAEGPEPLNVYSGNVVTDKNGVAWVELPAYFTKINRDLRYTLTVVDDSDSEEFVQVKAAQKVRGNRFKIRSSVPDVEVSWEVKGVRNDRFVQEYGAPVEREKPDHLKGKYQHPELYGQPEEMGEAAVARPPKEASANSGRAKR